jgi:hypothetical protein
MKAWVSKTGETKPSLRKRAMSFVRAVTGSKTTEAVFAERMRICSQCPHLRQSDGKLYCGACGCGQWRLAELSKKLRFANLECPKGKWSADNG